MNDSIDYEIFKYVDQCLVIQSIFLNLLWGILLWGWLLAFKRRPDQTLSGGSPGAFQWVIGFLVWAITFGVSIYDFEAKYWFLGFAIANGALLSIINPAFALCFSMSMLLMRPWELMSENSLILEIPRFSMFFSIAWSIFYFMVIDRFSVRLNKVVAILLAYLIWTFITSVISSNPVESKKAYVETMVRAATLFFLIYHLARDRFALWSLKATLVTVLTCVGLISVVFYFQKYTDGGRLISFGIFKNTNDVAAVMALMIPIAAAPFFKSTSTRFEKVLALFPMSIAMMVLVFSQSRGAVLALAMCGVTYALIKIKRKMMAITVVLLLIVGGQLATKVFKRGAGDLEGSSSSRKSFWISGLRMAMYNPVFGVGFNQFPDNFEKYALEIVGEYGKRTAHSSWVLALAEGGIIGLLLFSALYFFGAILCGFKVFKVEPEWLYASVAYGTAITFLSHTYMLFPYILIAVVMTAATYVKQEAT